MTRIALFYLITTATSVFFIFTDPSTFTGEVFRSCLLLVCLYLSLNEWRRFRDKDRNND